jgi:hypothetical protein
MKDNFQPKQIDRCDVLEFGNETHKLAKLLEKIKAIFLSEFSKNLYHLLRQHEINILPSGRASETETWFDRGVDCEVLKVGATNWQKGKIRLNVSLEFIPDNVEENIWESEVEDVWKV